MGFAETNQTAVQYSASREHGRSQNLALSVFRIAQVTSDMYQSATECLPGHPEP